MRIIALALIAGLSLACIAAKSEDLTDVGTFALVQIQGGEPHFFPAGGSSIPVRAIVKDSRFSSRAEEANTYFGEAYQSTGGPLIVMGPKEIFERIYWAWGSEHVLLGKNVLRKHTFTSDTTYPLTFKLVQGKGYVYLCGRGHVITPKGKNFTFGSQHTVAMWLPMLKSEDQLKREAAAQALFWLAKTNEEKDKIVALLIGALSDQSWEVRRNAAEALGRMGDLRAVKPLALLAQSDEYEWVRSVAKESAAIIEVEEFAARLQKGDMDAVKRLITLLSGRTVASERAKNALVKGGKMGIESLISALIEDDDDIRGTSAELLGQIADKRAFPPLKEAIATEKVAWVKIRIDNAIAALYPQIGEPAMEVLFEALKDGEDFVRRANAAEKLATLGNDLAFGPLKDALVVEKDDDTKKAIENAIQKLNMKKSKQQDNPRGKIKRSK